MAVFPISLRQVSKISAQLGPDQPRNIVNFLKGFLSYSSVFAQITRRFGIILLRLLPVLFHNVIQLFIFELVKCSKRFRSLAQHFTF